MRKFGVGGSANWRGSFTLPSYTEKGFSTQQSADALADYFQLYHRGLTLHQQLKLKAAETDNAKPVLEDWQVYDKLRTSKKPNSTVPGDLPVKIINELSPELTKPVTKIYNKITKSGVYPRQWVIEYQTAFPKSNPPPY